MAFLSLGAKSINKIVILSRLTYLFFQLIPSFIIFNKKKKKKKQLRNIHIL